MADNTKIEWTDATWNVVNGCSLASPGCTNCYAMKQAHRFPVRQGLTVKSKGGMVWTGEVRFNEAVLTQPLKWKRPRMIFVCAHGDLFHESVPDEWIDQVFAVMALASHHTFQVLTKRADRMREFFRESTGWRARVAGLLNDFKPSTLWNGNVYQGWQNLHGRPDGLPNVWLGASVEDQARKARLDDLRQTPAAVRWISVEPLLESLGEIDLAGINWVVVGGESGPGARPMHPNWARSLRDQCQAAGVPFFFKQWGDWFPYGHIDADGHQNSRDRGEKPGLWHTWVGADASSDDAFSCRIGKKQAGRLLDGREWSEYPA